MVSGEKGVGLKGWLSGPRRSPSKEENGDREPIDKHRIAILPMSNISPDPADEYFADGMTEEMILTVSKIEGLEVISRTSIMQYKKNAKPVKEVGQALAVGTVLEGSVRKAGNKLRVTVQLIDATKDNRLWSNSYDREIQDVFAIQTDIAENVADALKLQLLGEKRAEIKTRTTNNPDAYSLYLKGRFYWNERNPESVKRAMQYFESAITKEPRFALPYVGLADCYLVRLDQGLVDEKAAKPKVRSLIDSAMAIDNRLAEAHTSMASLLDRDWNWDAARAEHRKAIQLNPNYATAHQWYALHLAYTLQWEENLREIRIAQRLDPISPVVNMNVGLVLVHMGRVEEGIEQLKRTVAMEPDYGQVHAHLGQAYLSQSRFDEGIVELQTADKITGGPWGKAMLGYAYAVNGEREKAIDFLRSLEEASKNSFVPAPLLGALRFVLGDREQAYALLKKGFDDKSSVMPYLRIFPIFKEIRADPRFMSLLNKISG